MNPVISEEDDILVSSHGSELKKFFIKRVRWIEVFTRSDEKGIYLQRKRTVVVDQWPNIEKKKKSLSVPPTILICLFEIIDTSEREKEEVEENGEEEKLGKINGMKSVLYKPILSERYSYHKNLGDFYNEEGEPIIQKLVKFFSPTNEGGKWSKYGVVGKKLVFTMATHQMPFQYVSNPLFFRNFKKCFNLDHFHEHCDFSVIWRDKSTKVCIPSMVLIEDKSNNNFMWKIDENMEKKNKTSSSEENQNHIHFSIRSKCKISSNNQRDIQYSIERKSLRREIKLRMKITTLESVVLRYEQIFERMSNFEEDEVSEKLQKGMSPSLSRFRREKLKNLKDEEEKWMMTLLRADERTSFDSTKQNFGKIIEEWKASESFPSEQISTNHKKEEEEEEEIKLKSNQFGLYDDEEIEEEEEEEGEQSYQDDTFSLTSPSSLRTGCFVLTGDEKGYISCWNYVTGKRYSRIRGHEEPVFSILPISTGKHEYYVSCSLDNWVKLYEHQNPFRTVEKFQVVDNNIMKNEHEEKEKELNLLRNMKISTPKCICEVGNDHLVIGCLDGRIRFCELTTNEEITSVVPKWDWISHNKGRVLDLCFFQNRKHGDWLISCGSDKSILCWDMRTEKLSLGWKKSHLDWVSHLELVVGNNDCFFSASNDATVKLWDVRVKKSVAMLRSKALTVCDIKSCGSNDFIVAHSSGEISTHDVRSFSETKKMWMAHRVYNNNNRKNQQRNNQKRTHKSRRPNIQDILSGKDEDDFLFLNQDFYVEHFVLDVVGLEDQVVFVSGSKDKKLKVWNLDGECLKSIQTGSEIRCVTNPSSHQKI